MVPMTLRIRYSYHTHLTDEETEAGTVKQGLIARKHHHLILPASSQFFSQRLKTPRAAHMLEVLEGC